MYWLLRPYVQGTFACTAYVKACSLLLFSCLCLQVDAVIGADGANSRVAKEIDAGEYDYAIAFQERIRIPDDKMDYYKDLAEMYVGDDVSPDFYGWVFPKYDHVAVGTGTVVNKTAIKQYQQATRDRSKVKTLCCHVQHLRIGRQASLTNSSGARSL